MYQLPTFDTVVDAKCYPLSYKLDDVEPGLQPDWQKSSTEEFLSPMEPFENDEYLFEEDSDAAPVRSMNVTDVESFYLSTEQTLKVDDILNSYPTIPFPLKPNQSVYDHPLPPDNSLGRHSSPHVLTLINIQPYQHGNVTFQYFLSTIY